MVIKYHERRQVLVCQKGKLASTSRIEMDWYDAGGKENQDATVWTRPAKEQPSLLGEYPKLMSHWMLEAAPTQLPPPPPPPPPPLGVTEFSLAARLGNSIDILTRKSFKWREAVGNPIEPDEYWHNLIENSKICSHCENRPSWLAPNIIARHQPNTSYKPIQISNEQFRSITTHNYRPGNFISANQLPLAGWLEPLVPAARWKCHRLRPKHSSPDEFRPEKNLISFESKSLIKKSTASCVERTNERSRLSKINKLPVESTAFGTSETWLVRNGRGRKRTLTCESHVNKRSSMVTTCHIKRWKNGQKLSGNEYLSRLRLHQPPSKLPSHKYQICIRFKEENISREIEGRGRTGNFMRYLQRLILCLSPSIYPNMRRKRRKRGRRRGRKRREGERENK